MQRIGHTSRLVLVVLAILVCPGAAAQVLDDMEPCCPTGFLPSQVGANFEAGTTRQHVEEIVAELDVQVTRVTEFSLATIVKLCVPIGEEQAFVEVLRALPEVRSSNRNGLGCGIDLYPPCECCLCGLDCVEPLPPCDPKCEIDADSDTFADSCDTCTDTDDDGFGNPEFDASFTCPIDNCPDEFNPGQADLDADGIGDACDRKLTICHNPPGRPARAHTITIAVRAFPAHVAHGDGPGACVE